MSQQSRPGNQARQGISMTVHIFSLVCFLQLAYGCPDHPPGCAIKGNKSFVTGEKIYHMPGGEFYDRTVINKAKGERWFCTEDEAMANGWRKSKK